MVRLRSLLPALGLAVVLGGTGSVATALASGPAAGVTTGVRAASAADGEALAVTIDRLSPSTLPRRADGEVEVSGTVTNVDDETWSRVNLYPVVSTTPMTTETQLEAAAASDPLDPVGDRITDPGPYATIEELAPGESAFYSFSVPRARLPISADGVYWFGVHALGEGEDGRDDTADGRARTFLPVIDDGVAERRRRDPLPVAVVVPMRHRVVRAADGSVAGLADWLAALQPGGQLDRLVDLGERAGPGLTWLVDPAVLDAVRDLAAGNPPRALVDRADGGDGDGGDGEDEDGSSASASPSASAGDPAPSGTPEATTGSVDSDDAQAALLLTQARKVASAWLSRAVAMLQGASQVLALPYGDLDISGAAAHDPELYDLARKRSQASLSSFDLTASPGVGSPSGYLSPAALDLLDPSDTVLATDQLVERAQNADPDRPLPAAIDLDGTRLMLTSSGAASGGPGPDDPLADTALRQRILGEAVVRLLAPGAERPLVVQMPTDWAPRAASRFLSGLRTGFTDLVTVGQIQRTTTPSTVPVSRVAYPQAQADYELQAPAFEAVDRLIAAGRLLDSVLPLNDTVVDEIVDQALSGVSYLDRGAPASSTQRIRYAESSVRGTLRGITITAPAGVTLSSTNGRFSATVTNDLDVTVEVALDAVSDRPMRVTLPKRIVLAPLTRTSVLLDARTPQSGVHNLTLEVTDTEGTRIGSSVTLPVRSAEVSRVIWLILGTGVSLLFGTVGVRTVRRLRAARRRAAA